MKRCVLRLRSEQLKILDPVVLPVAVSVMNDLGLVQGAANVLRHDEAMLEDVAANVGHGVVRSDSDDYVSERNDRTATLPLGVPFPPRSIGFELGSMLIRQTFPASVMPRYETHRLAFKPPVSAHGLWRKACRLAAAAFAQAVRCHDRNVPAGAA